MVRVSTSMLLTNSMNGNSDSDNYSHCSLRPEEFTPPPSESDKLQEQETAGTPTDIRDVHF